jgi:predicted nucleotidyltransferase
MIPEIMTRFPSITVMYLFGSHAFGTPREESDVDIGVFTDGSEPPMMDLELGVFIEKQLKRSVDVVIMQKVSPVLQHEVLSNKIRIYEKDPQLRIFQENRSLREYLDAMYYQQKRAVPRKAHG